MAANLPEKLAAAALYHLAGALPLESYSRNGPTLYALTISGLGATTHGHATIAGPAVNARGLTEEWPDVARQNALKVLKTAQQNAGHRSRAERAAPGCGRVVVIVLITHQRVLYHYVTECP